MRSFFLALTVIFCLTLNINAQNITNTLGIGGVFKIKSTTTDFFTLSQANGNTVILKNLELGNIDNSTSLTGVITKNGKPFIHNYQAVVADGANTFVGFNSGNFTMSGHDPEDASYNTGVGYDALNGLTTGSWNSAFGLGALFYNTSGSYNSAFGDWALNNNTTGFSNSAFGHMALNNNTTGHYNSAFGKLALGINTTGGDNSAFGTVALYSNTTGYNNNAFGDSSLYSNTTGYWNTAVGHQSLYNNTTGYVNTAIGYHAGSTATAGTNLTLIGYNAQPSSSSANNEITLGDANVAALRCHVTSITSLSDARDKKNIQDLQLGIDFLMKLKPRQFNWDRRDWYQNNISDGSKMKQTPTAGFIAQELDAVQTKENAEWLNLVLKSNPDKLEATYGNLLPVMVKAIQDIKKEKDEQIARLQAENNILVKRLESFEEVQRTISAELKQLREERKQSVVTVSQNY